MKRSLIGEKNPGYLAGHSDNWKDERENAVCLFVSWRQCWTYTSFRVGFYHSI